MTNNSPREEFEEEFPEGLCCVEYDEDSEGEARLVPVDMTERAFAWFESELSKARQQGREEAIEEVKFQASILFPETEGARATAAHLVKNLRDHFTPKN